MIPTRIDKREIQDDHRVPLLAEQRECGATVSDAVREEVRVEKAPMELLADREISLGDKNPINAFRRHDGSNTNKLPGPSLSFEQQSVLEGFPFGDCKAMGAHFQKSASFGTPSSASAYQLARTYRFAAGIRF